MKKTASLLGLAMENYNMLPGFEKHGKSRISGRMKTQTLNPEGFRNKPTKRRAKVKAARKFNLKNRK